MTKLSPDGSALGLLHLPRRLQQQRVLRRRQRDRGRRHGRRIRRRRAPTPRTSPPRAGAYDTTHNGSEDAFVTKLNPAGSALAYSTYIGGSRSTPPLALAVDGSGNAYIAGYGTSADYPTTAGAFDTSYNGELGRLRHEAQRLGLGALLLDVPGRVRLRRGARDRRRRGGQRLRHRPHLPQRPATTPYPTTAGALRHHLQRRRTTSSSRSSTRRLRRSPTRPSWGVRTTAMTSTPRGSRSTRPAAPTSPATRRPRTSPRCRRPTARYNGGAFDAFVTKLAPAGSVARLLDLPRRLERRPRERDRRQRGDRQDLRRRADRLLRVPDDRGSVRHQLQRRLRRVRDEVRPDRLHPHEGEDPAVVQQSLPDSTGYATGSINVQLPNRLLGIDAGRSRRLPLGRRLGADPGPGRRARGHGPEPDLHDHAGRPAPTPATATRRTAAPSIPSSPTRTPSSAPTPTRRSTRTTRSR